MRKRNSQKIYKTTIVFIILDILAIACFIIMYGPWDKVRNMYVNTALKTMSHQYFANIFYSQKTIDKIAKIKILGTCLNLKKWIILFNVAKTIAKHNTIILALAPANIAHVKTSNALIK